MKARITITISSDVHGVVLPVEIELDKFTDWETLYAAFLGVGAPILDSAAFKFSKTRFSLTDGRD